MRAIEIVDSVQFVLRNVRAKGRRHTQRNTAIITSLERPNGLCFFPDESHVGVVDSGSHPPTIHVFPLADARSMRRGRFFAD